MQHLLLDIREGPFGFACLRIYQALLTAYTVVL